MSRRSRQLPAPEHPESRTSYTRAELWFLCCIVLMSLAVRVAYHYEMRGNPLADHLQLDELFHDQWANAIASGDVVGEGVFFRAPLYPYLLGLSYWLFGSTPEIPRLLQHVAGSVLVLLVYFLTRTLFGIRAAVISAVCAAFYGVMISFEGRLLFDVPLAFLVLLWFTLALMHRPPDVRLRSVGLGLLLGLICIMRPTFLALAPLPFGYLVWSQFRERPQFTKWLVPSLFAFLIPILVVTARNAVAGGDFVLIASQGGINFHIGNNAQADGISSWLPEAGEAWGENREVAHLAEQAEGRKLRPSEVSAYWYAKGWEFIRTEPFAFARLFLKKLYLFWSHIEIANNLSFYWFERDSSWLRMLQVGFWLIGPLGIVGCVLAWSNVRARPLLLFVVLYSLVTAAFFVADRFRIPAVPILCVLAGYSVHRLIEAVTVRSWKKTASIVSLIAAGWLLVNSNFAHLQPDTSLGDEGVRGHAALRRGDLVSAARHFGRASASDPANSSFRIHHGIALWGLGRTDEAGNAFRSALAGNPFSASINLAHLYFNAQQVDSARWYADRAIRARPYAPGGYIIAAKVALVTQNHRLAEELLRKGAAAGKDDFMYGDYLLAGIAVQTGRMTLADSLYRTVLHRTAVQRQSDYSLASDKERYGEDLPTLHAKARQGLGRVLAMHGLLDSSEMYLRSAAHLLPRKGDVWADWGVCLLRLNRLDEADTVMQRAVALSPMNPEVWFNYAAILVRKGEIVPAERALARALTLRPDFEEARRLQAALSSQGRR